jgi:N-acetylglucosamine-6-sulfatase
LARRALARLVIALVLLAVIGSVVFVATRPTTPAPAPTATPNAARPNIVLILTDDQRYDELQHMPIVKSQLIDRGVKFTRGFVSNSLCCPSRATILSGQYSGTNGVWSNVPRYQGGFKYFKDTTTIATVLQRQGYYTGLVGKYFNGYKHAGTYVPPGWNHWFAVITDHYFGPVMSNGGTIEAFPKPTYQTDLLAKNAVSFINQAPSGQPLFLYWAPHAPHKPSIPAPKYHGALAADPPYRSPAYNEADVSDKPAYIRSVPRWNTATRRASDTEYERMQETLLSVDDSVGSILRALRETGRLNNTLIVYMTDNGWMQGDHRWRSKAVPYDGSIRVPFIVRWDAAGWNVPRTDSHIVANVDLAPTWATAAGTTMPGSQGLNLLPVLDGTVSRWRKALLIEHYQPGPPSYCGIRTRAYMYAQYSTGEEELYDLRRDPWEMTNVASDPGYHAALVHARKQTHRMCNPPPPGFVWTH